MLVFAAYLEEIKEVRSGRMDGDQILVWVGRWSGQMRDREILRALLTVVLVGEHVVAFRRGSGIH